MEIQRKDPLKTRKGRRRKTNSCQEVVEEELLDIGGHCYDH